MERNEAIALLMAEIQTGLDSTKSERNWISEEAMAVEFGVKCYEEV